MLKFALAFGAVFTANLTRYAYSATKHVGYVVTELDNFRYPESEFDDVYPNEIDTQPESSAQ